MTESVLTAVSAPASPGTDIEAPTESVQPIEVAPARRGPLGRIADSRTFSALHDPNFRLLYAGNVLQFGSMQMQMLVRGVLAFQLTGSFAALGIVSLANAIPGLVFSLVGGVAADRFSRKTVIQSAQIFNMFNTAALAVLAGTGMLRFEYLVISAALQGGVMALMMPSRQSIILDLVGRERLTNAVALNTSGMNLMQLVGPGLGGALLALFSPALVFWLMAGMYLAAVTFTVRLPKEPVYSYTEARPQAGRGGGFRDIAAGLKYVGSDATIRTLMVVNFLIVLASMPYTMMLAGFVKEVLHRGPAAQGILMSVSGVGAIVGSLSVASMSDRGRGRMLLICACVLGFALVAFSISTVYYVTLPIMVIIGAATAGRMSIGQVLIQTYAADEYRGRVMAVWMMQFSLVGFGTFFVGILAEVIGPQLAIGGLAAFLLLVMASVSLFVPRFRNLD